MKATVAPEMKHDPQWDMRTLSDAEKIRSTGERMRNVKKELKHLHRAVGRASSRGKGRH